MPEVRVTAPSIEVGAELQSVQLWAVHNFDSEPRRVQVVEGLNRANLWVALGPVVSSFWLRFWGAATQRWGSIGDVDVLRAELRAGIAAEAVY